MYGEEQETVTDIVLEGCVGPLVMGFMVAVGVTGGLMGIYFFIIALAWALSS